MDEKLTQKVLKFQQTIAKLTTEKDKAQGAYASVINDLEKKFKIKSIESLGEKIDENEDKLKKLEEQFEKMTISIEGKYPWDTIALQS